MAATGMLCAGVGEEGRGAATRTLKTSHEPKVALKRFLICEGADGAINIYAWAYFRAPSKYVTTN